VIQLSFGGLYDLSAQFSKESQRNLKIITSMMDSVKHLKNTTYYMKALERIDGKFLIAESEIMIQMHPKKLYFKSQRRKISVLYEEGKNNNQALVKAKILFNTSISLDPYGNMMRKNQHYTIHEIGFEFITNVMARALLARKDKLETTLTNLGKIQWSGLSCIMMKYEDDSFHYYDYKVGKNESVSSIATKLTVSDYVIRKKNNLHSFYGAITEGLVIKVPSNYVKKVVFYIDEATMLPVNTVTFDEDGIYESYELTKVKINQKLTQADFDRFYKE